MKIKSRNLLDTEKIAYSLAKVLKGGEIILLNGDLGTGKTTFVKAIAKALGIKENVTSPSFTLLKSYKASKFNLIHVDAYRLEGGLFDEIEDYISDENVIFIEWSSMLKNNDFIKENLSINLSYISKNQRMFEFVSNSNKYDNILEELHV